MWVCQYREGKWAKDPAIHSISNTAALLFLSKEMTKALLKEHWLPEPLPVQSGQGFQFYFLHCLTGQWKKDYRLKLVASGFSLGFIIGNAVAFHHKLRQLPQPGCRVAATLLTAGWSSAVSPARRRACTRWRTGPRAGWLYGQSRQTPRATGSCGATSRGVTEGCGGRWQNVPSACRRGEPARPWAGRGTRRSWKVMRVKVSNLHQ